jgi:hypothetical protein
VSLVLILNELDTIADLTAYLCNRVKIFRSPLKFSVRGEEELVPIYFRGYSDETKDYDIARALLKASDTNPDYIAIDGGFWSDFVQRPEYRARIEQNKMSYLWDRLIEKFARHQIDGTGASYKPEGWERHEGGMRYMALEPRAVRRGLSAQILDAIETFPENLDFGVRTLLPADGTKSVAYLFMQVCPIKDLDYDQYRSIRRELLMTYSLALLHDRPEIDRVVGIALEPPRLFSSAQISEDMALAERAMNSPDVLATAKMRKTQLGLNQITRAGNWSVREFPDVDTAKSDTSR